MSTLGLALDDAALAIARGDDPAQVAPSIVDAGRGAAAQAGRLALATVRGAPTAASSRHWFDLAQGSPPSRDSARIARAELAVRLAALPAAPVTGAADATDGGAAARDGAVPGAAAVLAVPALFDGAALARVLAVCRAARLPVAAFVDAAALTAAALRLEPGAAIVLEVGLHHAGATRVDVAAGEARRRSARLRNRGGLVQLQESWLQLVSEAMVLRTRFDPLHEAATEQRLYDQLPEVAARAAATGSAGVALEVGAGATPVRHEVQLTRDQFATRGEALYRDLVAMIHELRPAGASVTLVGAARLASLPGLRELLAAEFPGCTLCLVPDGFAARAAALFAATSPHAAAGAAAGAVPLRRGVARFDAPLELPGAAVRREQLGGDGAAARIERPTHLLWSGRALPLAGAALEIGREPGAGGIVLAEGLAGVSRLHCTLRDEDGAIVLVDHSRHGTFVNGERVAGRARLRAGDRLRIGDPGVELALIAVGAGHGAPQG